MCYVSDGLLTLLLFGRTDTLRDDPSALVTVLDLACLVAEKIRRMGCNCDNNIPNLRVGNP